MNDIVLDVRDITKRFGALIACEDVSLTLEKGEIHALIGPNGAGKSTLIKQITGEMKPDAGSIAFNGRPVDQIDAVGRARLGMARTFQISSLALEHTVLQNVVLAVQSVSGAVFRFFRPAMRDPELVEPAMAYLAAVELAERAHIRAADLSHGERRKLEIAIALALKPKAFLLDEPMAGMGPEGSRQLTDFLDPLRAEAPILLVEHDMDAVFALADRISVLVYGRIIATGSVEEIRNHPAVREAYLGEEAA